MSEELDLSRRLADEGDYKKAAKSLARVEYKARLYEVEAEGMSDLALLLRDRTSGSLRDECVRLHDVAQRYLAQHEAERAERLDPTVALPEVEQAPSTVSGRTVVLVFGAGLAATVALAAVSRLTPCDGSGGLELWYLFGLAGAVSFGIATTAGIAWLGRGSRASIAVGCIGGVIAFLFSAFWLIVLAFGIAVQHCPETTSTPAATLPSGPPAVPPGIGGSANHLVPVLVSRVLIPKGTRGATVTAKRLYLRERYPSDLVLPGAISDPASLDGRVAEEDIYAGLQLLLTEQGFVGSQG